MMPCIHGSKPIKLWSVNTVNGKWTGKKLKGPKYMNVCDVLQATLLEHFITKSINNKISKDEK